jgi:rhamnogalacturonyl hydrolase YesR
MDVPTKAKQEQPRRAGSACPEGCLTTTKAKQEISPKDRLIMTTKIAMLCVQRYTWEQGVCAQALFEAGDDAWLTMAYDAVARQSEDGRLAAVGDNVAVTDSAASGEVVWRAYELTQDESCKTASDKMLKYLMEDAPRTNGGLICHNTVSFETGFSPNQIWADSIYMLPAFLAIAGEFGEAQKQIDGYLECLSDLRTNRLGTGLLYDIYDADGDKYVRQKLWATGNGWALLGLARMITLSGGNLVVKAKYIHKGKHLLDAMLKYRCESGMFHDILDESDTFEDGTSAMMTAIFIYRGLSEGWLVDENGSYVEHADRVYNRIPALIDEYGVIRGVCGAPHFKSPGTSAEAQAMYIMMSAWRAKINAT